MWTKKIFNSCLCIGYQVNMIANVWRAKECDIQMFIKAVLTKQTHQNAKGHSQTAMWVGLTLAQRRDCITDVEPMYVAAWLTTCLSDQSSEAKETVALSCNNSIEYCSPNNLIAPQLWLANRISRCPLSDTHCKAIYKRWPNMLIMALFIAHSTTGL